MSQDFLTASEPPHAVVPAINKLDPTDVSPDIDLADSEVVLRGVVRDDIGRLSGQPDADERPKLCSKSRIAVPLLVGQTNVGNLLLWSRKPDPSRKVLLLHEEDRSERLSCERRRLLFVEIKDSTEHCDITQDRTEHRSLRLRFGIARKSVARSGTTFARPCGGDFSTGNECRRCRVPRRSG